MNEQTNNNQQTITEEKITAEQNNPNWLDEELKNANTMVGNLPDGLHLEENKTTEIMIDLDKGPFRTYEDKTNGTVKKIIPCIVNGEEKAWWLNTHNPIYKQLLEKLKTGQKVFKIFRIGKMKDTRYTIVEE